MIADMDKQRYIVHIDMDAFFAAIEQRDNPQYRRRPLVVGADPKQGRGRGVVSTCSYEARAFGVRSAMPISIAYRKCPQAIFLSVNMQKYSSVSEQIFAMLEGFTPLMEKVSIDEAFLDISDTYQLFGPTAYDTCVVIKRRIKETTGLTCSIGLASTKMTAKIASDLKKPDGLVEVKEKELLDFLWPLDIDKIWGIGDKTKNALNKMEVFCIGDLAKKNKEELVNIFGRNGIYFWEMAHGIDESKVLAEREVKSISNETTFEKDTLDRNLIERELAFLCEKVSDRLRKSGFKARTITLKIRLEGFKTYNRSVTIATPTNFAEALNKVIKQIYHDFEVKNKKIRLVGVQTSNLSSSYEQTLFQDKTENKKENVHKALDLIREKFGDSSIFRAGSLLGNFLAFFIV